MHGVSSQARCDHEQNPFFRPLFGLVYKSSSWLKRGIGHSGKHLRNCFRVRLPSWPSRSCKKEQFQTPPETPVLGMDCDVAPASITKSISASPTVHFSWSSGGGNWNWGPQVQGSPWTSSSSECSCLYHLRASSSCIVFLPIWPRAASPPPVWFLLQGTLSLPPWWLRSLGVPGFLEIQHRC